MSKRRAADISEDSGDGGEASEFRAAVRDVKPLTHVARAAGSGKLRAPRRRLAPMEPMPIVDPGSAGDGPEQAGMDGTIEGADVLSFRRPGVRDQELRRLRRGLYPIAAELDLHGLDQAAARSYLAEFIEESLRAGRRCVRIIHGKGYRSGARGPVLKIAVNTWLRRYHDVMAFTSARTIDGGTGALYVLLRS